MNLGGESAREHHDVFSETLIALLAMEPNSIADPEAYRAAVVHGFSYYYWQWDTRAATLYEPVREALRRQQTAQSLDLSLFCDLVDFLFFVVWAFNASSTKQCRLLVDPLRSASLSFAKTVAPRKLPLPANVGPYRIAWLAMYAESKTPMSVALRHLAPVWRAAGHELAVYGWNVIDDAFGKFLREIGASVHELGRKTPEETILAVEAQAARDQPAIAVSDMNNAVPTALFSRRLAPIQIFLQAGMPAWPVQNLDAIFNSFGFDSEVAGWGNAEILGFNPPWDLAALNPPVGQDEIALERSILPQGFRLIGSYGRFAKVTEPYLRAAEQILLRCTDTAFLLGGVGDASPIEAFIAASPVGERIHVEARWVPGHVWGHILEVLVDTWPVTGGESCRETIAKGKPVVTLHSREMPAIDLQRDPTLVTHRWAEYADRTVRLLQDSSAYSAACQRALALAASMSERGSFAKAVAADLARTVKSVRAKRSLVGRIGAALHDVGRARKVHHGVD